MAKPSRSKKKTSKKKPAKRGASTRGPIPWAAIGSWTLSIVVFGGAAFGISLADQSAGERLAERSTSVRFDWAEAVSEQGPEVWPLESMQIRLDADAHEVLARSNDPRSPEALAELGAWLEGRGWVERVRSVERLSDGTIEIRPDWRAPVAVVRQNGRDYLAAAGGFRLPWQWELARSPFPVVVGADRLTPATSVLPGEAWPDQPVLAGVELLELLQRELSGTAESGSGGYDQVAAVDVAEYERRQRLIIITDRGNRVVWGRAPSSSVPDPVSTAQKLRNLGDLRRHPDFGMRIDAGRPLLDLSTGPVLIENRR